MIWLIVLYNVFSQYFKLSEVFGSTCYIKPGSLILKPGKVPLIIFLTFWEIQNEKGKHEFDFYLVVDCISKEKLVWKIEKYHLVHFSLLTW